jgi:hypothetical protein
MWKLDGQNDGLFQRLFGHLEPRDVIPADVGLVDEDRACKTGAKLLHLGILVAILIVLPEFPPASRPRYNTQKKRGYWNSLLSLTTRPAISHPICSYRSSSALFANLRQVFLELFGTAKVLSNLGLDQDF